MAMLAALSAVMRGGVFACLHVEHGLRPDAESRGDAGFVREFCEKNGISCRVESFPPGKIASFAVTSGTGIEAAARFFRRRALFREAKRLGKNTRILIAHTRDDMLETALMRVLRGAGPGGLAAMPQSRGRILRPLLNMSRADVLGYLTEKNIPWREDSSNTDITFLRNRIRHKLVPLLNEQFPSWKSGLAGMAATQSLAASFITDEAVRRVNWEKGCNDSSVSADGETFFSQSEIIREEALFRGIDRLLAGKKKSAAVKRSVLRRFCEAGGQACAQVCAQVCAADLGPLRVQKEGRRVVLSAVKKAVFESGFSLLIKEPGLYNLKGIGIEVRPFFEPEKQSDTSHDTRCSFSAGFPLVFRPGFKDDSLVSAGKKIMCGDLAKGLIISAVDRFGTAAFIGLKGIMFKRDALLVPPSAGRYAESGALHGQEFFLVTIGSITNNEIGGINVQQSE
jgi:tRNA(Ile)-lysidine synthase